MPCTCLRFRRPLWAAAQLFLLHAAAASFLGSPARAGEGSYDGITFTDEEALRALDIANTATRTQLEYPGELTESENAILRSGRPWASLQAVANASGIEAAAMQNLLDYSRLSGYFAWIGPAHDLNRATGEELEELYGIGPATAGDIIDHRTLESYFEHEDQLMVLDGMGATEVDALMTTTPGAFVSPYTGLSWSEPVDRYSGPYHRPQQLATVGQLLNSPSTYENQVVRIAQAVVTYVQDPLSSVTFKIGDWGDTDFPFPTSTRELKVYMPDRANTRFLTPYTKYKEADGEPYDYANFYRPWAEVSSPRVDRYHVYSLEGVLINDPTYGWELVIRPIPYAGEDRINFLEEWLNPGDWKEFLAFFDANHVEATVISTYSDSWSINLPARQVYAHPCVAWARANGSSPPTSGVFDSEEGDSQLVTWFNPWLEAWKLAGEPVRPSHLVINEVVKDPQSDWSSGGWNGKPGTGSVSDTDEYIELYNGSTHSIDLTGFSLLISDSTPSTQILGSGSAALRFSPGSSLTALLPGGFVLVGDPYGAINNDARIELLGPDGVAYDWVGLDGNASSLADEALMRCLDGADSDRDSDWCRGIGTPGITNLPPAPCPDVDGDGVSDVACGGADCDDANPNINPGLPEACTDQIDNNCDGVLDYQDSVACPCFDADGDGHTSSVCGGQDCNDADSSVNPTALEACEDGMDNDCDLLIDLEDAGDCPTPEPGCGESSRGNPAPLLGLLSTFLLVPLLRRRASLLHS